MPQEIIRDMIYFVRGQKVMLDSDLATLYGVETKQLKRAVKRNLERFPEDFMIELTIEEYESLRCQFGTLKRGKHSKYLPFSFTEQGVAMLSSVLNSDRAIQVNIAIMRTFTQLRQLVSVHKELANQLKKIEKKVGQHDEDINAIIDLLKRLHSEPEKKKQPIGFYPQKKKQK
ncbi:MAG: ORF6N domain-containing protein [Candidatus Omnitrophica bacterium]|nr:ORF6N domain-containing protein [Candidatus Omnitrophota bacterium]MBU1996583.1 ORF6N domain-containing protein [Candidatus Omnitrophota bacterium]